MIAVVSGKETNRHEETIESMCRLRYLAFVERPGWQLDCHPGREVDQFDHDDATHLVATSHVHGKTLITLLHNVQS